MKKTLLFIIACICVSVLSAQFTYKIKADSVLITNDSCSAELNLENSTKSVKGFLYNKGNGRTEFRRGAIKLSDSTYLVGFDTIKVASSSIGNYILNQNSSIQSANYRINGFGQAKAFRVNYDDFTSLPDPANLNDALQFGTTNEIYGSRASYIQSTGYNSWLFLNPKGSPIVMGTLFDLPNGYAYQRAIFDPNGTNVAGQKGLFTFDNMSLKFNRYYGDMGIDMGVSALKFGNSYVDAAAQNGMTYYNTTYNRLKTYSNSSWQDILTSGNVGNGLVYNNSNNKLEFGGIGRTDGRLMRDTYINTFDGSTDRKLFINTEMGVNYGGLLLQFDRINGAMFRAGENGFNQQSKTVMRVGNFDENGNDAPEINNTYLLTTQEIFNNGWGTNGNFKGLVVRLNGNNADNNYGLTGIEINTRHHYTNTINFNQTAKNTALKLTANSVGAQGWLKALTYALYVDSGRVYSRDSVMFGTTTPGAFFHVNGTSRFDLGSDATGDIFYRDSLGFFKRLPIGTNGQILTVNGNGLPSWSTGSGGGSGLLTADNGLTANTSTNVRLGGTLASSTSISGGSNTMTFTSTAAITTNTLNGINTGAGNGVFGQAVSGTGVTGTSTSGPGGSFYSSSNVGINVNSTSTYAATFGINPTSTNTVATILSLQRLSSGTAADGIGMSIDLASKTSDGSLSTSNQLISKWSTANTATRSSQFIITGVNSGTTADRLTLSGNGSLKLNNYGSGTFTGTPAYTLQVDANGNIIEGNTSRLLGKITSPTSAIANTETQVVGVTIPANTLAVGDIIRVTAYGVQTQSSANSTSIYRIRIGSTTLTGNVPASSSWANGNNNAKTNTIIKVSADVLITAIGSSGAAIGQVSVDKGFTSATTPTGVTSTVTVNTTISNIAEFTFISGASSTTNTFHTATIEIIKN